MTTSAAAPTKKMTKKAVALLSGGLDSSLAVKMMIDQGIEVVALNFVSSFCTCDGSSKKDTGGDHGHKHSAAGCRTAAKELAYKFDVPITVKAKGLDYIEVVRNPKYGYGQGMNPCMDCRVYMFKEAKTYMEEIGASFIITGEVLGQRPMSQRLKAMEQTDRDSELTGYVLRPLSAQVLEPTEPELQGIVDREKLLDITGRSRRQQMDLADELEIEDYPCPSGGCLLTDKIFSKKVKDLFEYKSQEDLKLKDLNALKLGRHFRHNDIKYIVSRDETETKVMKGFTQVGESYLEPIDFPGPSAIVSGYDGEPNGEIETAASLILRYSGKRSKDGGKFKVIHKKANKEEIETEITVTKPADETFVKEILVC